MLSTMGKNKSGELCEEAILLLMQGLVSGCPNHRPHEERMQVATRASFCTFSRYEKWQVLEFGDVSCHDCILNEMGYAEECLEAAKRNIKNYKPRRKGA